MLLFVAFAWEAAKWLAGDPWRIAIGGFTYTHTPPLAWRIASDISLPHLWTIVGTLFDPVPAGPPLWLFLTGAAFYTLRTAFVGFAAGALLGLGLGIVFVHSRFLERALVPWVVGSQTVPIIAIAPIVVVALGASWISVAVVATYLTFFPVAIAAIRGPRLRPPGGRADALVRGVDAAGALEAAAARLRAVPLLRASGGGGRQLYCRDNPQKCADIVTKAGSQLATSHQLWMMNEINALIWPSPNGIGQFDTAAWNQTVDIATKYGILKAAPSDGAYRTDLAQAARTALGSSVDTKGASFQKLTVTLNEGGK